MPDPTITDLAISNGRHEERLKGLEEDMDHAWDAVREIRGDIKQLLNRVAWIVGGISVASVGLQLLLK